MVHIKQVTLPPQNIAFMIANTPAPPYYAVIFTSVKTDNDPGYSEMAEKMIELAQKQEGFLGIESAREELGITVSYWRDLESINSPVIFFEEINKDM